MPKAVLGRVVVFVNSDETTVDDCVLVLGARSVRWRSGTAKGISWATRARSGKCIHLSCVVKVFLVAMPAVFHVRSPVTM